MTLVITFDLEGDLGSSILFHKWILEVRIIWKSGITLFSMHISSKVIFSSVSDMLILCYLAIVQTIVKLFQVTYNLHKAGYWTK